MNVLILSAGTRNKIVQYFREGIQGKTIAADMTNIAPAVYEADAFYIVPRIDSPEYFSCVIDICKKEDIDAIVSLIDPELSVLSARADELRELGIAFVGSSYELCELALDKLQMYRWFVSHGYLCAKTYGSLDEFYKARENGEVDFPVMVKPVRGSASISTEKINNSEQIEVFWKNAESPLMIQEFLNGQEIGADCYIDMLSGQLVSVFTKNKLRLRAGETDKSVSFKDPVLFELIDRFVNDCGWRGVIDIDIIKVGGEYYFNEINPRFGGGYPHAHECGCDFIRLIDNNFSGKVNPVSLGDYEENVYMMKYNEVRVQKCE